MDELMKELLTDEGLRRNSKALARFVPEILKRISRMPEKRKQALLKIGVFDESAVLMYAICFLSERFNVQVVVFDEEDSKAMILDQGLQCLCPIIPQSMLNRKMGHSSLDI
jgi:hypothetical protein